MSGETAQAAPASRFPTTAVLQVGGNLGVVTMPLWLGALGESHGWTPTLIGLVGSVEYAAIVVGSLVTAALGPRLGVARWGRYGALALLVGNGACALGASPLLVCTGRVLAGLGAGTLLACASAVAASSQNPGRDVTRSLIWVALSVVLAFLLLPFLIQVAGVGSAFAVLGLAGVPAHFCLRALTARMPSRARRSRVARRAPVTLVLVAATLSSTGNNILWPYLALLGQRLAIEPTHLGPIIGAAALTAAVVQWALLHSAIDYGSERALGAAIATLIATAVTLASTSNPWMFALSICGQMTSIAIVPAMLLALLVRRGGNVASAAALPAFSSGGKMVGPIVGGALADGLGLDALGWLAAALLTGSLLLIMASGHRPYPDPRRALGS